MGYITGTLQCGYITGILQVSSSGIYLQIRNQFMSSINQIIIIFLSLTVLGAVNV